MLFSKKSSLELFAYKGYLIVKYCVNCLNNSILEKILINVCYPSTRKIAHTKSA